MSPWMISLITLLALLVTGWVIQIQMEARDRRRFPPPGRMVSAGLHRLHMLESGSQQPGQPVVVLEPGIMFWSFHWRSVLPRLGEQARVIAYDRAGLGWSEPGPSPRSPEQVACELHQALLTAGEHGPYVLVGHSLGGIFVREFARQYPQEVAGLVLVDSAHERQFDYIPGARQMSASLFWFYNLGWLLARLGILRTAGRGLLLKLSPSVRTPEDRESYLASASRPMYFRTCSAEAQAFMDSTRQGRPPAFLGSLPLAVIQAAYPEQPPPGYQEERWQAMKAGWQKIQADLVNLSTCSRLIPVQSGHNVMSADPDVIVSSVCWVFDQLRS